MLSRFPCHARLGPGFLAVRALALPAAPSRPGRLARAPCKLCMVFFAAFKVGRQLAVPLRSRWMRPSPSPRLLRPIAPIPPPGAAPVRRALAAAGSGRSASARFPCRCRPIWGRPCRRPSIRPCGALPLSGPPGPVGPPRRWRSALPPRAGGLPSPPVARSAIGPLRRRPRLSRNKPPSRKLPGEKLSSSRTSSPRRPISRRSIQRRSIQRRSIGSCFPRQPPWGQRASGTPSGRKPSSRKLCSGTRSTSRLLSLISPHRRRRPMGPIRPLPRGSPGRWSPSCPRPPPSCRWWI